MKIHTRCQLIVYGGHLRLCAGISRKLNAVPLDTRGNVEVTCVTKVQGFQSFPNNYDNSIWHHSFKSEREIWPNEEKKKEKEPKEEADDSVIG